MAQDKLFLLPYALLFPPCAQNPSQSRKTANSLGNATAEIMQANDLRGLTGRKPLGYCYASSLPVACKAGMPEQGPQYNVTKETNSEQEAWQLAGKQMA